MRYSVHLCVLVLSLLGVVQEGCSIRCYSCVSRGVDDNEACVHFDKNRIELKTCGISELEKTQKNAEQIDHGMAELYRVDIFSHEPQLPLNCLKQVTKVGDQEVVLRGCQLAATDQLDICVKVRKFDQTAIRTIDCSLCSGDGCNSSSLVHPLPSLLALIVVLLRL